MEVAKDSIKSSCDNVSCVKDSGDDAMKCQSDWGFLSCAAGCKRLSVFSVNYPLAYLKFPVCFCEFSQA